MNHPAVFASLLASCGINATEDSCGWLFDFAETKPFLQWICENIKNENVLSEEELLEYNKIRESGALLDSEQIQAYLQEEIKQDYHSEETMEELEADIASLTRTLKESQANVSCAANQRDQLAVVHAKLSHQMESTSKLQHKRNNDNIEEEKSLFSLNETLNSSLLNYQQSVMDLISLLETDAEDEGFLYAQDLSLYASEDDNFTRKLKTHIEKQFLQDLTAKITNDDDSGLFSWMKMSEPSSLFLFGHTAEEYRQHCTELARLQSIYATSMKMLLDAETRKVRVASKLQYLSSALGVNAPRSDAETLRKQTLDARALNSQARQSVKTVTEGKVNRLLADLSELQVTSILHGDYDLKILRQNYHLSKQNEVIAHLIGQRSRHQLLKGALEADKESHKFALELLSAANEEFVGLRRSYEDRLRRYLNLTESAETRMQERKTACEQDSFVKRIYESLVVGQNWKRFEGGSSSIIGPKATVSCPVVLEVEQVLLLSKKLLASYQEVTREHKTIEDEKARSFEAVKKNKDSLLELLFTGCNTSKPPLTNSTLTTSMLDLESSTANLAGVLEELMKDLASKRELLKIRTHDMAVERRIFIDFFNNPDQLRAVVKESETRVLHRSVR